MKRGFVCCLIMVCLSIFAQSPEKMSYQAIIRNAVNNFVTNQAVGMQISILQGSADGTTVYAETHTPVTNANGLATIEIGGGTVISGSFSSIDWSQGPFFIKTETDPTGGTNYSITGTSQLLSVPYALYAKKAQSANHIEVLPQSEIDSIIPVKGMLVFNSSTGFLNIFNGTYWVQTNNGDCVPDPSTAIAGNDTTVNNSIVVTLYANTPSSGTGTWSVVSGTGGTFSNIHSPQSTFTGADNTSYILKWTISTRCGSTEDEIALNFRCLPEPSSANAGNDVDTENSTVVTLNANTPESGTGMWSIVSGGEGTFSDASSPASTFTGSDNSTYILRWTISNSCGSSSDEMTIYFGRDRNVGDLFGGGVVCWVDSSRKHGLIVSMVDLSDNSKWSEYYYEIGTTTADNGAENTVAIVNSPGGSNSAARLCADYVNDNYNTGVYSDWYLPAYNQMQNLWSNLRSVQNAINFDSNPNTVALNTENIYWTSTEDGSDPNNAFLFSFFSETDHPIISGDKTSLSNVRVRAIRSF